MAAPGGSAEAGASRGVPAEPDAPPGAGSSDPAWQRVVSGRVAEEAPPIVLGERSRFDGLLAIPGNGQLDGELSGDVICRGKLEIGAAAHIEGTIEARELIVLGEVVGDAFVRERIELGATARVVGSIRAPRVALATGCVLRGRCEMPTPGAGDPLGEEPAEQES